MLPPAELNALQQAAKAALPTTLVTNDTFNAKRNFQRLATPQAIAALIEGTKQMAIEIMRLLGLPQWNTGPVPEPGVYLVWSEAPSNGSFVPTLAAWTGEEFQHISGRVLDGVTHWIETDIPYDAPVQG